MRNMILACVFRRKRATKIFHLVDNALTDRD